MKHDDTNRVMNKIYMFCKPSHDTEVSFHTLLESAGCLPSHNIWSTNVAYTVISLDFVYENHV